MPRDPYDRWPALSRRQQLYDWLCVLALGLMLAAIVTAAVLVVVVVGA